MDVFGRLAQPHVMHADDEGVIERQRRAMSALAYWGSDCLGYDDGQARAYETRVLRVLDGGATVDRLIAEIGTDIERAGKPAVAGLVGVIFAQALQAAELSSNSDISHRREGNRDTSSVKMG